MPLGGRVRHRHVALNVVFAPAVAALSGAVAYLPAIAALVPAPRALHLVRVVGIAVELGYPLFHALFVAGVAKHAFCVGAKSLSRSAVVAVVVLFAPPEVFRVWLPANRAFKCHVLSP